MRRFVARMSVALTLVASALSGVLVPASATAVDSLTISGGGAISPGLTLLPTVQSFWFKGTASVTGTHAGTYSCAFYGTDSIGTVGTGAGTLSGSCGPIAVSGCTWTRSGVNVHVACSNSGAPMKSAAGSFVFTPGQTPPGPVYTYSLTGTATYTETP